MTEGRFLEMITIMRIFLQDHPFSSYNFYAYGKESDIITQDVLYEGLGSSESERQARYRDYVLEERAYD